MRYAFLISGVIGFLLVALTGYYADRAWDLVLRDSAIGCLVAALAGRWFWSAVDRAFTETVEIRRAAAVAAEEAAAQANPPAPSPSSKTATVTKRTTNTVTPAATVSR